ncbi:MAG TPA: GGDEF domain-containing protein [Burkholderiaceae bacterium]|nr:GGDEF domain-containing protein [Burkholderiaceae bacterium]
MRELVDHLADLTVHRDREVLDVALVEALNEMLAPLSVAVHRAVGDADKRRWLTRASITPGDIAPRAEGSIVELELLPAFDERPAWRDCVQHAHVLSFEDGAAVSLFPLGSEAGEAGVLEVRSAQPLLPSERRTVAAVLRICRNFESLLDYSERDTLTGLLNRKTFDAWFLKVALTAPSPAPQGEPDGGDRRREIPGRPYLAVIDVDHFKGVNDRYGHLIGDEVLVLIARVMRSTFRYHDRLYRFGGEEFVVLLRAADQAGAGAAFERLRANVARYPFPQVGHVTASIGYTEVRHGDTPTAAFERADRAVYHAKAAGRDQVHDHAALVSAGVLADAARGGEVSLFD